MWLGYPGTSGASYMDYIITDAVTSPVILAEQYAEKLAYMPKTFFIGDHRYMFPHMRERVVLASKESTASDNWAVINGTDLSEISKLSSKKLLMYPTAAIKSNSIPEEETPEEISFKKDPVEIPVIEIPSTTAQIMLSTTQSQTSLNGIIMHNGVTTNQVVNNKVASGEEIPQHLILSTRQQYGLPENAVIFCNFNQLYKIDPGIFRCWCNIVRNVPNSFLWLLRFPASGEPNVLLYAQKLGLPPNRVIFSNVAPKEEHVRRGQLADVCLDSPLCNGHTTGMDVLWAGVPMVTLPCETLASRVASSQLYALGCPELVASSKEEYENIAIKLGSDREYLKAMRAKVWKLRTSSSLFDSQRYALDMEKLFKKMWERHQKGSPIDHITE
ncbi:unnamed protein product [Gordionus sp. m RMFG-2023]